MLLEAKPLAPSEWGFRMSGQGDSLTNKVICNQQGQMGSSFQGPKGDKVSEKPLCFLCVLLSSVVTQQLNC